MTLFGSESGDVCSGNIVDRESIHNNPVQDDEIAIEVKALELDEFIHPKYNYSIEVGSYCQWPLDKVIKFL